MACVDEEEVVHWPTDAEHMVKAQRSQLVKCQKEKSIQEKGSGVKQGKEGKSELRGKKIKDRKESRRRRRKIQAAGDGESLDCCVLLTRLEEKGIVADKKDAPKPRKQKNIKVKKKLHSSSFQRHTKSGFKKTSNQQALEPKINQSDALLMQPAPAFEPRRRRMASLNAEAVNSLLLYRDNSLASNLVKKRQLPPNEDPANGSLIKTEHKTQKVSLGGKAGPKEGSKKKKRATADAQNIDWLALLAPTPRRQAGLTAATLLRLTSSASGTKRKKKIESKLQSEEATTAQGEGSNKIVGGETMETKRITHPKHEDQLKHRQQGKEDANNSQKGTSIQGFCSLCKSAAVDPDWKATTGGGQVCLNHALQCSSLLGFSLNTIKEEQVETEVSTCYCCSKEGCIKYCHRLALFVKDKTFKEPEDSSLSEVFHHHHHHHLHHHHLLQSARSITHPAAITISPNTYTCLPGYYVRFSHPDNASSPISPAALCPRSGKGTKLLPSTGPQSSGITHPVYCCTSVETCYGEPCRISSCSSYSSVIPAIARGGCSFSTADCTTCNHSTKRGDYPSTLSDHHSPSSIPICPSPRIPTGCPIPTVPPAGQSVPHIQTPLSDPSQPQPPLQVAKECPQSAKSPSGSRSGVRSTGSISSAVRPVNRNKQKLISASAGEQKVAKQPKITRQKTTNGWRPVGPPFHKKVFSVGEEAPVLRKCFEGVQRDGELIQVRDTVLLKSGPRKKSLPYVAKISALWEEPESGELMMSLFWYYRPEHTQGGHNPSIHCENEVFASRHQDVNSVACIEDKCYVLTLAQYCRFCALVKRRRDGVRGSAASLIVPPVVGSAMPTHHCVPDDVDPELVFFCRHVYDFRYGRLLKNLQ